MKILCSFLILVFCLVAFGCNNVNKTNIKSDNDNKQLIQPKDTLIIYDIEGVSAEGAEAKVRYKNNLISECKINIYGETGQAEITYIFLTKEITVMQTEYKYKKELTKIESQNDMTLIKNITYNIDYKGKIIGKTTKGIIDIFNEIKNQIPFKIN